uniref:hypothetical protein n=1 Tax=Actinoplanes aureus TaxID=2792083 RepID=UPI0035A01D55
LVVHDTRDEQPSAVHGQSGVTVGHETSGSGESVATSTSPEVSSHLKQPRRSQQRSWSLHLARARGPAIGRAAFLIM